jgi:hypothetical protein
MMPVPEVVSDEVLIARFVAALTGLKLGHANLAVALDAAQAAGGVAALADQTLRHDRYAGLSNRDLAIEVVQTLGLSPRVRTEATIAVWQSLEAAGPARGQALLALLGRLDQLQHEFDSVYQSDGNAFAQRVDSALAWGHLAGTQSQFIWETFNIALTPERDIAIYGPASGSNLDEITYQGLHTTDQVTVQVDDSLFNNPGGSSLDVVADPAAGVLDLPSGLWLNLSLHAVGLPGDTLTVRALDTVRSPYVAFVGSAVDVHFKCLWKVGPRTDAAYALVDTAPGSVDHAVLLREIDPQGTDPTKLMLELMDPASATSVDPAARATPLRHQPFNGFTFTLSGETVRLADDVPYDESRGSFNGAQTYDELLSAVQTLLTRSDNLERWPSLALVSATLGSAFDAFDDESGTYATGTRIQLSVPVDSTLSLGPGAFFADDGYAGLIPHARMGVDGFRQPLPPEVEVVLDGAGRGGVSGDLLIGVAEDHGGLPGYARFKLRVEHDSALGVIASTHGSLQEVVVQNGLDAARFSASGRDHVVSLVAGPAIDDDPLPGLGEAANAYGFTDVRLIDLSGLQGDASFDALLTGPAMVRYAAQGVDYRGGAGNDTMMVVVSGDVGAGTTRLAVAGGAGDDHIELRAPQQTVTLVFGSPFGQDHVRGFDDNDRLDFSALGGREAGRLLLQAPAPGDLVVIDGRIDRVAVGGAMVGAADVAARYVGSDDLAMRSQLCLTLSGALAQVWQVVDGAGPGEVTVTLAGSVQLDGMDWLGLSVDTFG